MQAEKIARKSADPVIRSRVACCGSFDSSLEAPFPLDVSFLRRSKPCPQLHRHDLFGLSYLYCGELIYEVEGRPHHVRQHDLFVLNGTMEHRVSRCLRPNAREILLQFLPEVITGDRSGDQRQYLAPFLLQDDSFPHVIPASSGITGEVRALLRRIHAALPANSARARLTIRTYLKMILILVMNHYSDYLEPHAELLRRESDLQRLRPILDSIADHYRDPITVGDGAAILHMSRPHFMRVFRGATGETFVSYLNRVRIMRAEDLLASTNKTVAEISHEAGFKDQSYFGQVFRRLVRTTPREYREHRRRDN